MQNQTLLKEAVLKVGDKNGSGRIWLEGLKLAIAGFTPGRYFDVETNKEHKILRLTPSLQKNETTRKVSSKKKTSPVIDMVSRSFKDLFSKGKYKVQIFAGLIVISQPYHEVMNERAMLTQRDTPIAFEYFAGGGTLAKAVVDAGFEMSVAVELEPKYSENLEANFPNTLVLNEGVDQVCHHMIPHGADLFVAGVPCETFSPARRSTKKREDGTPIYTDHDNAHLVCYVIEAIRMARPKVVMIEEVVAFGNSVQASMLRGVLKDLHYDIHETVIQPEHELSKRKRYCMVASLYEGFKFPSFEGKPPKSLRDIIFNGEVDRPWFSEDSKTLASAYRRRAAHKAKGNGFGFLEITPETEKLPTLTKGYAKLRDEFYLTDDGVRFRPIGAKEAAEVHGFPNDFILPDSNVKAIEVLGQGVLYRPWKELAQAIIIHLSEQYTTSSEICA